MPNAKGIPGAYCIVLNESDTESAPSKQLSKDPDEPLLSTHPTLVSPHYTYPLPTKTPSVPLQHSARGPNHPLAHPRIVKFAVPTMTAIDGPALGCKVEVTLACEIRIAHDIDRTALLGCRLGIVPGTGNTQRLKRLIRTL